MKSYFPIIILLIYFASAEAQNETNAYSFFIAGHTYGKPGVDNVGLHPPFKDQFAYIRSRPEIAFGVLTGDIVIASTAQNWDEVDDDIDSLGLPIHFAVGNHDMTDRDLFESRYGSTYFHFIHQNDLFIVLDPNLDAWNISESQLHFLQEVITNNIDAVNNIFVFFHQVLWKEENNQFNYISWNSQEGRDDHINFWTEVVPVFSHYHNKVYMFAGDLGASWSSDVTYDKYENITLIASGMGDRPRENFVVVNVAENGSVGFDLICLSDTNTACLGALSDRLVVNEQKVQHVLPYPNPTNGALNIPCALDGSTVFQLFNMQGELLLEDRCLPKEVKHTVDLSQLPNASYLVTIINGAEQTTTTLVIE